MTVEREHHEDQPMADEQEKLSQKLDAVGIALTTSAFAQDADEMIASAISAGPSSV